MNCCQPRTFFVLFFTPQSSSLLPSLLPPFFFSQHLFSLQDSVKNQQPTLSFSFFIIPHTFYVFFFFNSKNPSGCFDVFLKRKKMPFCFSIFYLFFFVSFSFLCRFIRSSKLLFLLLLLFFFFYFFFFFFFFFFFLILPHWTKGKNGGMPLQKIIF